MERPESRCLCKCFPVISYFLSIVSVTMKMHYRMLIQEFFLGLGQDQLAVAPQC